MLWKYHQNVKLRLILRVLAFPFLRNTATKKLPTLYAFKVFHSVKIFWATESGLT